MSDKAIIRGATGALELRDPVATFLKAVRRELEENPEARDTVAGAEPASSAAEELVRILSVPRPGREGPVLIPGREAELRDAVDQALAELEVMRRGPKSLYLIDEATGKAVMPFPADAVYQPPDFVGEDGKLHKAKPIIHPGISSSLAIRRSEEWRKSEAVEKLGEGAVEHLLNPDRMAELAVEKLAAAGVRAGLLGDEEPESRIEFGREHVNGVFQSPNPSFRRAHLFAGSLTRKILAMAGPGSDVRIGRVKEHNNGKQRWFTLGVTVRRPEQLP